MAELPVLGLRIGKEVSMVHEQINRQKLLEQRKFEYRKRSIEDIWGMIDKHLGVDLPLDFIGKMGFDAKNFKWKQLYHQNALSAFFIGAASQKPFDLDGSQGIMEVISKVKQGKVEAETLTISGVIDDSKGIKRMVAVGFNLGRKSVQRMAVSLTKEEIPEAEYSYYHTRADYMSCFNPIPDTATALGLRRSFSLAEVLEGALVSSGMVVQSPEQQVMIAAFNSGDRYSFMHPLIKDTGFFHLSGEDANRIGFKDKWYVEYPAVL